MKRIFAQLLVFAVLLAPVIAQERRIMNRPYIDERRFHYGFHLGMHLQDLELRNNGYVVPETGERWYAEVDNYQPGFSVGVLGEWRFANHLSLRVAPTLDLGQKHVVFHEQLTQRDTTQNIKSTYIALPVAVKFAAPRYNNFRPYMALGMSPMIDLTNRRHGALLTRKFDCMVELSLGCDVYFGFFKLIPEVKCSLGLLDILQKDRSDLIDQSLLKYTCGLDNARSRMVTLTFYFE